MVLSEKRTRGPNKQTPWSRNVDDGVSVLRLALDTSDPVQRRRLEDVYAAAYQIRQAVQNDTRHRLRAYWAAVHEREHDPSAARERLGLSRPGLERAAYRHLDGAPHLRRHVTKALAMHLADNVWTAAERHLFRDASGKRHGMPRIGRWFDFARLPGRARSHTKPRKWETFRLHGTLAGHRTAYTRPGGRFFQPRHMHPVASDAWWAHTGPLAVVFSGLGDGTLVLPVRLPAAPSNQPILDHHLADPSRWHKIDLVRYRDPRAEGGWRYEAHLMVLTTPYVAPGVAGRRAAIALAAADRAGGIDVNVSNVTIASHVAGRDLQITRIARDAVEQQRIERRTRRERRRQRDLERSRRAMNRQQYQLSKRQEKHARRRALRGLPPADVIPAGPRNARSDGRPLQAYRHDQLSARYRRERGHQVNDAAAWTRWRRDHARQVAAGIVGEHGYRFVVEDCNISAWASSWGRSLAAFSPATLLAAIDREAAAVVIAAGARHDGVARASTHTTALSQHCLCGARVVKTLADRGHVCSACGLRGDRDAVAATLAAFIVVNPNDPASAIVDFVASAEMSRDVHARSVLSNTVAFTYRGRQDVPSESNAWSARDGSCIAWSAATLHTSSRSGVVARRTVGTASRPTPDEPGRYCLTTLVRTRLRTNISPHRGPPWSRLRDIF